MRGTFVISLKNKGLVLLLIGGKFVSGFILFL